MSSEQSFHLSLRVSDLRQSVEFYGRLLGVAPAKFFPDYAKFELEDPPVVLSLEPAKEGDRIGLDHLGIRLASRNLLVDMSSRIAERGLHFEHLQGVECCYSRQSKIYMNDPDGHLVEVYTVDADLADAVRPEEASAAACHNMQPDASGKLDHLLPAPFPLPLPVAAAALQEINLRGTFNAEMTDETMWKIVQECRRALAPGGKVTTHILAADREVQGEIPRLPEPAAHVRHVPVETKLLAAFAEAGFTGIELKRWSHASVFGFGGAEFREFMLSAVVPMAAATTGSQTVAYKGPFPEIKDELGNTYERGRRIDIDAKTAGLLKTSAYAPHFVFFVKGGGC